ncbi:MAG: helix-turn-helix domain-containing protein [Acidobacteriota bacterium]
MGAKKVLSTWEAGRYCNVSPYTVRSWIVKGLLPASVTPGGHRRVRRSDLDAFLKSHGMPVPRDFNEGRKRVLIVDHDPASARSCLGLLDRLAPELNAASAETSFDAGYLVWSFSPDLVIFDMDAQGFDWRAACERLQGDGRISGIRWAGVTRNATVENLEAAQAAGMEEVLTKPLTEGELRPFLRKIFPSLRPGPQKD